jgi:hypothetical protein
LIRTTDVTKTFEFAIIGGAMRDELFVPTPRTRLVIHCDRDGRIVIRILEGRTSGV